MTNAGSQKHRIGQVCEALLKIYLNKNVKIRLYIHDTLNTPTIN